MIRKKLIAGLSASVMAIAASATSVSAFADEVNLVQEQQELQTYVDSFARRYDRRSLRYLDT